MDELGEKSAGLDAGDLASDLAAEEAEPASDVAAEEVETPLEAEEAEMPPEAKEVEAPPEEAESRTERQIKGEEFERKTLDEMAKIEGMEQISGGGKSHSFDPCFYHPDVGVIVTDSKDYGSEERPGYVAEVSAFKPERIAPNMTKMLEDMDANEVISPETKDDVWQAFGENKGVFLVVGSDTTRMSENKQAEWGQFTNISDLQSKIDSLRKN